LEWAWTAWSSSGAFAGVLRGLCRSGPGVLPACTRKTFKMLWMLGADFDSLELSQLVRMYLDPGALWLGLKVERVTLNPMI